MASATRIYARAVSAAPIQFMVLPAAASASGLCSVHVGSIEIRQMQNGGNGVAQNIFGVTAPAHPVRAAAPRMRFVEQ
jgi:hypothetical protein